MDASELQDFEENLGAGREAEELMWRPVAFTMSVLAVPACCDDWCWAGARMKTLY